MPFKFENTKPVITDEQMVTDIRTVAARLGVQHLTQRTYREHGQFSATAIKKRFNSWNAAVANAGLSLRSRRDIPVAELFDNLINVWTALGRQPRKREMVQPQSRWTHHPYTRAFGGWLQAMRAFVKHANGAGFLESSATAPAQRSPRGPREPSLRLKFLVMRRDRFKCRYCGRSPASHTGVVLHLDHIIPWSQGGATSDENLQTLCDHCNLGKSDLRAGGA